MRLNNGKFAHHNSEKLYPWSLSLALSIRSFLSLASKVAVLEKSVFGSSATSGVVKGASAFPYSFKLLKIFTIDLFIVEYCRL